MRRTDPLIVGGGPAGTAAAIVLAEAGARPVILERSRDDEDPLCGGFLSAPTAVALARRGVDPAALGAQPVGRLRLVAGTRTTEVALPAPGFGLSRRALDRALREAAARAGAGIERGATVRRIANGVIHLADGADLAADRPILATGKHDLHGLTRPRPADPTLGLRTRLAGTDDLTGVIELHLFDGGYAGLVLQEDGTANLCLAVRQSRLQDVAGGPAGLIAALATQSPRLADRIGSLGKVEAVAQIPYGWRATHADGAFYRIGDQAGVIPSLAGEGIGIALASGAEAAHCWMTGMAAGAFQPELARRMRRPIVVAGLLWGLAERPATARMALKALGTMPHLLGLAFSATRMRHATSALRRSG